MTKIQKLSTRRPSPFSAARMRAHFVVRGPQSILWESDIEDVPPYYGWSVLLLKNARSAPEDYIETRSVYANLFDDTQHFAVLRAVSWNGQATRKLVREQGQNFELVLPARFVKLPVEQLKAWLNEFDGLSIILSGDCTVDDSINVRKLRIKQDLTTCIFERTWQGQNANYTELNNRWAQIWAQMTKVLLTNSTITSIDEDFWLIDPNVTYDFLNYQPDWFNLD